MYKYQLLIVSFLPFLLSAVTKASDTSRDKEYADSLKRAGLAYKRSNEFDKAVSLYKQSLAKYEHIADRQNVADCNNKIGVTYFNISNFDSALFYYFKSLQINDSLNYQPGLLKNYINFSNWYASQHQYSSAADFNHKGQQLAILLEDNASLASLYQNYGNIYIQESFESHSSDSAKSYFLKALKIYENDGYKPGISGAHQNLGLVFEKIQQYDSALLNYKVSIQLNEELKRESINATVFMNIGNIYQKRGNYPLALENYAAGLQLAKKYGITNRIQSIYGNLAIVYEATGDYNKALAMHKFHKQYSDSIYNEATAQQINELNTKYETEKTHKELAQAQVVIEQKNAERNIYLISIAIILAFMIVLVIIYQQRQNALKKLRTRDKDLHHQRIKDLLLEQELSALNAKMDGEEKERQRISKELHDRLGSILTTVKYNFESSNDQKEEDQELKNLINYALEETRNLSHTLASGVLAKFGLLAALNDLKNTIEADQSIAMTIDHKGLDNRMEQELEIDIYRIIQELVSNTLKYAHAKEIILQLIVSDNKLSFMYEDDGIGFNVEQENQGIGLKNMQARTKKHHTEIHIDSQPGRGMRAIIDFELTHKDDKATVSR